MSTAPLPCQPYHNPDMDMHTCTQVYINMKIYTMSIMYPYGHTYIYICIEICTLIPEQGHPSLYESLYESVYGSLSESHPWSGSGPHMATRPDPGVCTMGVPFVPQLEPFSVETVLGK